MSSNSKNEVFRLLAENLFKTTEKKYDSGEYPSFEALIACYAKVVELNLEHFGAHERIIELHHLNEDISSANNYIDQISENEKLSQFERHCLDSYYYQLLGYKKEAYELLDLAENEAWKNHDADQMKKVYEIYRNLYTLFGLPDVTPSNDI